MRSQGNNAVALCEGEINPDELPDSLVYKLPSGRPLIFEVHRVFGDEITLRPMNLHDDPLPGPQNASVPPRQRPGARTRGYPAWLCQGPER